MILHGNFVNTTNEAWIYAKGVIANLGETVVTEDRAMTKEVQNLLITIKNPLAGFPIPGSNWDTKALDAYAAQLLNPYKGTFDYTYGERINNRCQLESAIRHLAEEKSTRRAVIKTWEPCKDSYSKHVPCLQLIEFLVRGDHLNMTCIFRSQDIQRAYVSNVYGLGKLQEHVGKIIGIEPGTLTTHSISAHIYIE